MTTSPSSFPNKLEGLHTRWVWSRIGDGRINFVATDDAVGCLFVFLGKRALGSVKFPGQLELRVGTLLSRNWMWRRGVFRNVVTILELSRFVAGNLWPSEGGVI